MNSRIKISSLLETLNVVIIDQNRFVHFQPYGICSKILNAFIFCSQIKGWLSRL